MSLQELEPQSPPTTLDVPNRVLSGRIPTLGIVMRHLPHFFALMAALGSLSSCTPGDTPDLLPVPPQEIRVSQTLTIPLAVKNDAGRELRYRVADTMLPGFSSVTSISGSPASGEFRWTPLSSHVGRHELVFEITSTSGGLFDRERVIVEVLPSSDAAPVFLRPGAGGTHDLIRDPCVRFDIEIRDDDSLSVDIRERSALPDGASIQSSGPKSADFEWCPTRDQVAASERWTIELEANDGDHPSVPHDYVAVLRTGPKTGCPGMAPMITPLSPLDGERITSSSGYEVRIRVVDDSGLRDAPLLYWSTTAPDDPTEPDVTSFNQIVFTEDGSDSWRARIPSLGLGEGDEAEVYFLTTATDNDDASGTACDHRTDSPLITFYAVGVGNEAGDLGACESCTRSTDCASGVCVSAAGGPQCLSACTPDGSCDTGSCTDVITAEGATRQACGPVDICRPTMTCTADSYEPNDAIASATAVTVVAGTPTIFSDLQICSGDADYFQIDGAFRDLITVTVDGFSHAAGDLDLRLRSSTGTIVASSAGLSDVESASYCLGDTGRVYAQVLGFGSAQNQYDLRIERAPMACCSDDSGEPDDNRASARPPVGTTFEGTVCPEDDDFIAITVAGASRLAIEVVFDADIGDIDIELQNSAGERIAESAGIGDGESIDTTVSTAGTYYLRVYGYSRAANTYLGEIVITPIATCSATSECATGQTCAASGTCLSDVCTDTNSCPSMHLCPTYGLSTATRHCGQTCSVNSDCRMGEACKWFPEGRACGMRGSNANGAACTDATVCGGQRACVPWANGYCARMGCLSNADCETGTYCVTEGGMNVCVLECESDFDRCRTSEGYNCDVVEDVSGEIRFACVQRS
jgi:hypothetical protein